MKKIFSLILVTGLAVSAFATGGFPINSPQSGVAVFNGTVQSITNPFAPYFTAAPVFVTFGSSTNASPITNTVTATNWIISVASTNVSVAWNAYLGYPRVEYGTQAVLAAAPTNITFPTPYSAAPAVTISGTTNAVASSITTTNFTVTVKADQTIQWQSLGSAYAPGSQTVTY